MLLHMIASWVARNLIHIFQLSLHCSTFQWTQGHCTTNNHGNCYMVHIVIWVHQILYMWCIETSSITHEWGNELKVHFVKVFGQALCVFVFYTHVLVFFIMFCYNSCNHLYLITSFHTKTLIYPCSLVNCNDAHNDH